MSTVASEKEVIIHPWGIRANHPRNSDLLIQNIPGCRLRSTIRAARPVRNAKSGELRIPIDQARALAAFPEVPGMELHINLTKLMYAVTDPMEDNEELCELVRRRLKETGYGVGDKIKGVPEVKGALDVHGMKTLCREMLWLVSADEAEVIKGTLPTLEQIEKLPGRFLLNPGSRVINTQPRYEADLEAWIDRLTTGGG